MASDKLKYTDLRVGNYIYWTERQDTPEDVHRMRPGDFVSFQKYRFDIKGVPITEEWLMRCSTSIDVSFGYKMFVLGDHLFYIAESKEGEGWICFLNPESGESSDLCTIKYIHQLQNLYHALTGEELTIKNHAL